VGGDDGASTRTNATAKYARIGFPHYTNAEEPAAVIFASSDSTSNSVEIGGGTSSLNAVTDIYFRTAADTTTTTGTVRARIDKNGNTTFGPGASAATYNGVDIQSGGVSLVLGAEDGASTRTNNTTKVARVVCPHRLAAEEDILLFRTSMGATNNYLYIGGVESAYNALTDIVFYTGANNTNTTGVERLNIDSTGALNLLVGASTGGLKIMAAEALGTATAAATFNIATQVPTGARIIGCQLRVDTALSNTWDAAYNTGSTTAIATNQAVAKNTKVNVMQSGLAEDVTTDATDITITKNGGGNFTAGGQVRAIVYYETFTAMGDAS